MVLTTLQKLLAHELSVQQNSMQRPEVEGKIKSIDDALDHIHDLNLYIDEIEADNEYKSGIIDTMQEEINTLNERYEELY